MKKTSFVIGIIVILLVIGALFAFDVFRPDAPVPGQDDSDLQKDVSNMINVISLKTGAYIASPFNITGEARGYWYFEASFPIELQNASGPVVARAVAQADGDWMTEDFVPFKATLEWKNVPAGSGFVVLKRDNPSGLPQNDAELKIPVTF